jgi:hypothetical protein
MVGVPLTAGQHLVEYRYRNEAFVLGWKVSLICTAVFGLLVYRFGSPKSMKRKKGKYEC